MLPVILTQLSLTSVPIIDQIPHEGIWVYLMVFVIITLASTVVGGLIPDNSFLFLTGAVARVNGLSMVWLVVMAVGGGFVGYEINYWSGRLFGLAIFQGIYRRILKDRNVRKVLDTMEGFGPVTLTLSRVMPVMNLPSFIAGVDAMDHRMFAGFNLISSVFWSASLLVIGYFFGGISIISEYLGYFIDLLIGLMAVAIIVALVAFAYHYVKRNNDSAIE